MTNGTTRRGIKGEILSGVQRGRRWTPEQKVRIVEETYLPGMGVSPIPAEAESAATELHVPTLDGAGCADRAAAREEGGPSSEYRALEARVRKLHCSAW